MHLINLSSPLELSSIYKDGHPGYPKEDYEKRCPEDAELSYYQWLYREIFIEANTQEAWTFYTHVLQCISSAYGMDISMIQPDTPLSKLRSSQRQYENLTLTIMETDIVPYSAAHILRVRLEDIHNPTVFDMVSNAYDIHQSDT